MLDMGLLDFKKSPLLLLLLVSQHVDQNVNRSVNQNVNGHVKKRDRWIV